MSEEKSSERYSHLREGAWWEDARDFAPGGRWIVSISCDERMGFDEAVDLEIKEKLSKMPKPYVAPPPTCDDCGKGIEAGIGVKRERIIKFVCTDCFQKYQRPGE